MWTVFDYILICLFVWVYLHIIFLRQTSFMDHFKQLILDYMDIVLSGLFQVQWAFCIVLYVFPSIYACVSKSLVVGNSCILWG